MSKVLFTLTQPSGAPTLDDLCARYGFQPTDVDAEFGVIEVDELHGVYAIYVDAAAAARADSRFATETEGPFADARIEPFGLVPDDDDS